MKKFVLKKNEAYKADSFDISPLWFVAKITTNLVRLLLIICLGFLILYPIFYALVISFRDVHDLYDMSIVWISKHLTFDNFNFLFEYFDFQNALFNSLLIALGSSLIQVFVLAMTGYGFARFNFRGKNALFLVAVLTFVIPPMVTNLPNYLLFRNFDFFGIVELITGKPTGLNLLNNISVFYILALFGQGIRAGVFILIFRMYFESMPSELEQAAFIDGCDNFKAYFKVMLPCAKTTIFVVLMLSVVWYWNDHYTISTYAAGTHNVTSFMSDLWLSIESLEQRVPDFNIRSSVLIQEAGALITVFPVILLFTIFQKQFVQGMERSGLVG